MRLNKIPLYAGLTTLVLAVLVTSIQLGTKGSSNDSRIQASQSKASLQFQFTQPDIITVLVTSEKPIAGVDVVLRFENDKLDILPSSLKNSGQFVTTGASVDEQNNLFRFSALAKDDETVSSGIIASFQVRKSDENTPLRTTIRSVDTGSEVSAVVTKDTLEPLTITSQDITFTL